MKFHSLLDFYRLPMSCERTKVTASTNTTRFTHTSSQFMDFFSRDRHRRSHSQDQNQSLNMSAEEIQAEEDKAAYHAELERLRLEEEEQIQRLDEELKKFDELMAIYELQKRYQEQAEAELIPTINMQTIHLEEQILIKGLANASYAHTLLSREVQRTEEFVSAESQKAKLAHGDPEIKAQ